MAASLLQGIVEETMEPLVLWREIENRFRAIRDPRLQAGYVVNPTEYLDELREQIIAGIKDPDRPIDVVCEHAKVAAHIGAMRLAGTYIGEWMISGGSEESRYEFRLTARLAARAARLVTDDATEDEAVDRWLNLLKRPGSPYYRDGLTHIENLPAASAAMCVQLAAEGYQPDEASQSEPQGQIPDHNIPRAAPHATRPMSKDSTRTSVTTKSDSRVRNVDPPMIGQMISSGTLRWRHETVKAYRDGHNLSAADLASCSGLDESVIRAIIREDSRHGKLNASARDKLLRTIKVSVGDWYAPRT